MSSDRGGRVRRFFELETRALLQRFQIVETLLPNLKTKGAAHRGEEGRHIEALLREFLNRHLPKDLRAVSGFILRPSTKIGADDLSRTASFDDEHSRQLDIIVYDFARFPVYEHFEEVAIVPPEGVVAILSVKKSLSRGQLEPELRSLAHAVELCRADARRTPFTALIGFRWNGNEKKPRAAPSCCFNSVQNVHAGDLFDKMITEICVISQFTVFKYREEDSDKVQHAKYVYVDATERPSISLQRLLNSILSVFYDVSRGMGCDRPGFVSFERGTFKQAPLLGYVPIGVPTRHLEEPIVADRIDNE